MHTPVLSAGNAVVGPQGVLLNTRQSLEPLCSSPKLKSQNCLPSDGCMGEGGPRKEEERVGQIWKERKRKREEEEETDGWAHLDVLGPVCVGSSHRGRRVY